jgi:hypothetical protein
MGISPKGGCEIPLSVLRQKAQEQVEGERNRNLNREVWESSYLQVEEDVKVRKNSNIHSLFTRRRLLSINNDQRTETE